MYTKPFKTSSKVRNKGLNKILHHGVFGNSPNTLSDNNAPDMCRECDVNGLVLPSIEHFQDRLKNPKLYYNFYHNFIKAVIGENQWKRNMQGNTRLGTSQAEAFAQWLVENNYFAWVLEYKAAHKDDTTLITAYDDNGSDGDLFTVTQLEDVEINMSTDGFSCVEEKGDTSGYREAKRKREELEASTTELIKDRARHKGVFNKIRRSLLS